MGLAFSLTAALAPASELVSVTPAAASVERYHPLFVTIVTTKTFTNGYDPDQIKVDLELTGPDQEAIVQPCFYKADQNGNAVWEARFAPRKEGNYTYSVTVDEKGAIRKSDGFTLQSRPTAGNGFMHVDTGASALYGFRFDSGRLWRGIGENVAWEPGGYSYAKVLPRLAGLGCNMIRIWHCPWHMPIEWNSAPVTYNRGNSEYMDQLVSLAEKNGIYMMVMMNDYREFSEQFGSSPYNRSKGGWCGSAKEFFTNAGAKAAYKKKIRYYVARWGYSPNIQSWEFFNEIDNAIASTGIDPNALTQWHDEMSAEFHRVDPYGHPVTSSVSWVMENMWSAKGIDFTQTHLYGPSNKISKLPAETKRYVDAFKKPYVCGEFSRRWEAANTEPSANYRTDLHYGMWLGMVQSTPIAPMTWWWDSHFNWGDDFVFKSAAGFSNDIVAKTDVRTLTRLDATATGNQQVGGVKTGNHGYVWVSNYAGGSAANNVTVTVTGLPAGSNRYSVEWYDTWNGGFTAAANITSQNGALTLNAGSIAAGMDKAARIVNLDAPAVGVVEAARVAALPGFRVQRTAAGLSVYGDFSGGKDVEAVLYDVGGREVRMKAAIRLQGDRLDIAPDAPRGGLYLLKVRAGARTESLKIPL
jgi:hypothetical protein